jgi:hypothetical protein
MWLVSGRMEFRMMTYKTYQRKLRYHSCISLDTKDNLEKQMEEREGGGGSSQPLSRISNLGTPQTRNTITIISAVTEGIVNVTF